MTTPGPRAAGASIGRVITVVALLASGAALLTATIAFGLYDRFTFLSRLEQRLIIQAEMIAANSASAIAFDDPTAAAATLQALESDPAIIRAAVITQAGGSFARYRSINHSDPAAASLPVYSTPTYLSDRVGVSRPIVHQGQSLGHVSIESDLNVFRARQLDYLRMAGLILVASFGAALLMAYLSQRSLARPISGLVEVADSIAGDQDYSRRAAATGRIREVNALAHTFNHMLDMIEARNLALVDAHAELDERVRQRTAELDAANKELEAFSYSVSHDLRAPLRHVTGFSELLGAHVGSALDDQGRRYLATITNASARMARLIDDLLAFSRIGRTTLSRQPVALSNLAQEAREEVMAYAPDRVIDWTIGPLPVVEGDPSMLHLVMVNLLSNAVKYTSTRPRASIELGTTDAGPNEVVMFVRDNGVGFDMQYADKLFGVFQRLHRAEQFEGTGIGLAHIKRIITRHGGRVWATSAVDQGATFFIALPLRKGPR